MKKSARAKAPKSQNAKFAALTLKLSAKAREGLTFWPKLLEIPPQTAFKIYAQLVDHLATDAATIPDHWLTSWSQPDRQSAERVARKYFKAFPKAACVELSISGEPTDIVEEFINPNFPPTPALPLSPKNSPDITVRFTKPELENVIESLVAELQASIVGSSGEWAPAKILAAWRKESPVYVERCIQSDADLPRKHRGTKAEHEWLRRELDLEANLLERLLPLAAAK